MSSQLTYSFLRGIHTRGICTSIAKRGFLPNDLMKSEMLSLRGLVKEKPQVNKKKVENHEAESPHTYGTMNISVEGYDMVVVEKFAKTIHRLMLQEKITVKDTYALPSEFRSIKYLGQKYAKEPGQMDTICELPIHVRVIQIHGLGTNMTPILLQSMTRDIPPGVKFSMAQHSEEEYLKRCKPNKELQAEKDYLAKLLATR